MERQLSKDSAWKCFLMRVVLLLGVLVPETGVMDLEADCQGL